MPIKNTARLFVFDVWLVCGSILKLVHIESISLWIKKKCKLKSFLKALSLMTFDFFHQWFVWTSAKSMWQVNLIKIPIWLEEKWHTIYNGKWHGKRCKVCKKGYRTKKNTLICVTPWAIWADLSFKQQSQSMSFRLGLLNLKLSNLKATVTHQKWCVLAKIILHPCMFY